MNILFLGGDLRQKYASDYLNKYKYTAKALIKYYARRPYDKELTLTLPTMEELMYFITKRQKSVAV